MLPTVKLAYVVCCLQSIHGWHGSTGAGASAAAPAPAAVPVPVYHLQRHAAHAWPAEPHPDTNGTSDLLLLLLLASRLLAAYDASRVLSDWAYGQFPRERSKICANMVHS